MIPIDKIRPTAKKLLEKTLAEQVSWKKLSDSRVSNSFETVFPNSRILISFVSPTAEPDCIVLAFYDRNGVRVGDWTVEEGQQPDWTLLNDLLAEANRSATGWDKVLEDVDKALDTEGLIGASGN